MTVIDIIMLLLIGVALPVFSNFSQKRIRSLIEEGGGKVRMQLYRAAAIQLSILSALVLLMWSLAGHFLAEIGFVAEPTSLFLVAMVLAVVFGGAPYVWLLVIRRSGVSPLRVLMVTGTTSPSKLPFSMAALARRKDSRA